MKMYRGENLFVLISILIRNESRERERERERSVGKKFINQYKKFEFFWLNKVSEELFENANKKK